MEKLRVDLLHVAFILSVHWGKVFVKSLLVVLLHLKLSSVLISVELVALSVSDRFGAVGRGSHFSSEFLFHRDGVTAEFHKFFLY